MSLLVVRLDYISLNGPPSAGIKAHLSCGPAGGPSAGRTGERPENHVGRIMFVAARLI